MSEPVKKVDTVGVVGVNGTRKAPVPTPGCGVLSMTVSGGRSRMFTVRLALVMVPALAWDEILSVSKPKNAVNLRMRFPSFGSPERWQHKRAPLPGQEAMQFPCPEEKHRAEGYRELTLLPWGE
jgi:hypothetical protein